MRIISEILTWGFGLFFILLSVAAAFDENLSIITSFSLFLAGFILLPPIRKTTWLLKHTGKIIASSIILFLFGIVNLGHEVQLAEARKKGVTSITQYEASKKSDVNRGVEVSSSKKKIEQTANVQNEKEMSTASLSKQKESEKKESISIKTEERKNTNLSSKENEIWDTALPKKAEDEKKVAANVTESNETYSDAYIPALAIAGLLSNRCDGLETTEEYKKIFRLLLENNMEKRKKYVLNFMGITRIWKTADIPSQMKFCLRGLLEYGPKGTDIKGLLRPNDDFKKLLKSLQ